MKQLIAIVLLTASCAFARAPLDTTNAITRIAFGSCNRHTGDQSYWAQIAAQSPDLWIWLGDSVYNDTEDMQVMQNKYNTMRAQPGYAAFRAVTDIVGTWDDHDYGINNGGKSYPQKVTSQQHFLDFLDEPTNSLRRAHAGIYGLQDFGPLGQRVRVIFIDDRYFSDAPGPQSDLLGSNQWAFLESALTADAADVFVIASGIQVLPQDHPNERWSKFPRSQKRLFDMIRAAKTPGVLFISGDRHMHEINMRNDEQTPYPLYELTSSGLTHAYHSLKQEKNRYRVGPKLAKRGFGMIEINWDAAPRSVELRIHRISGERFHQIDIPLHILAPHKDLD